MYTASMQTGRYILLLDILGFRESVESHRAEEVYKIVDYALQTCNRWEELNGVFKTIYFSDTIIFYQEPIGYGDWAFLDVYAIGGMLLSALLAYEIPARGAISFGEFEVRRDNDEKHNIFFGKALIEAYDAERKENWIGITICPSAWKVYEKINPGTVEALEHEGVWSLRNDGVLLLNPLIKLRGGFLDHLIGEVSGPYEEWNTPEFPNDLRAFRFINDRAKDYARRGDFSGPEAVKYHATVAFFREVLQADCFEWAERITADLAR